MLPPNPTQPVLEPKPPKPFKDRFHLLVDCRTEQNQRQLYEELKSQGFTARVLTL
jgi:hypothetical protein